MSFWQERLRGQGVRCLLTGASITISGLLCSCAVGPEFNRPPPPGVPRFTYEPLPPATTGGEQEADRPQRFVAMQAIPEKWWTALESDALNDLVDRALKRSPTITSAEAALRQAQEVAVAQRGAFYPSVQANYSPTHARVSQATSSPLNSGASVYTLHTAQLSVGYVPDVFGANRRSVESADAQREGASWQLRAAQLSLASNVINAALQAASLREQLAATEHIVAIGAQQLKLLETQRRLGAAPGAAVFAQEAVLRQSDATAVALRKQLAQQRDLLAVLMGMLPSEFSPLTLQLSALRLPDVPLTLPAQLVEHRPDVRIAEAQLHSANAQVGVAVANMLPQITLTGSYGASAETFSQLFRAGGLMWIVAANLAQPVFDGGTLLHRKRAAEAQTEQALAQYQATILTAFQNVADSLEAARYDAEQYIATNRQEAAAEASLRIARRQLELGDISYLALLNAETAYLQATIARIQAHSSRFSDVVAVYQALGGGWNQESAQNNGAK